MIFFVLFIIAIPLILGHFINTYIEKKRKGSIYQYLVGVFSFLCIFEAFHVLGLKLSWTFTQFRNYFFVSIFFVVLVMAVFLMKDRLLTLKSSVQSSFNNFKFSYYWILWGIVVLLFLLQSGNFFWLQPYLEEDITRETILTTIQTNTIYQYHPLTGKILEIGMTPIGKLNSLPILYASFISFFGMDVNHFLFHIIPVWGLILGYFTIFMLSNHLMSQMKDIAFYQPVFLIFYGLLHVFGDYSIHSIFFRASHEGWAGGTLVILIIIPFVLFTLLEKKVIGLLLAIGASVSLANPGEGLFLVLLSIVLYFMAEGIMKFEEVMLWKKQNKS